MSKRSTPLNPSEQLGIALTRIAEHEAAVAFKMAGCRSDIIHLATQPRLRAEVDPWSGRVSTFAMSEDGSHRITLDDLVTEFQKDVPAVFAEPPVERRAAPAGPPPFSLAEWQTKVATAPAAERAALLRRKAAGDIKVAGGDA